MKFLKTHYKIRYFLIFAIFLFFIGACVSFSQSINWNNFAYTSIPASFDWRNVDGKNYVTAVKDQGACGSCLAFGLIGALEANINIYKNYSTTYPVVPSTPDLSEQDILSCSGYGLGCQGAVIADIEGILSNYFVNTGTVSEECFPYSSYFGADGLCSSRCSVPSQVWTTDSNYKSYLVPITDMYDLKWFLVNYGPIVVAMDIHCNSDMTLCDLWNYGGGIYRSDPSLTTIFLHSVVIVGYGTENNVPYWIVKNSWGPGWMGESGYFRVARDDYNWMTKLWQNNGQDYTAVFIPGMPKENGSYLTKACADADNDSYCYWGLGTKPSSGCPLSCDANLVIADCDESSPSIQAGCDISSCEQLAQ